MEQEKIRLNKYLSEAGVCSRRAADRLIEKGTITVNGQPAVTGMRIRPEDEICIAGKPVYKEQQRVLLLFNKPRGIVCTAEKREKNNIVDYIDYPLRIYPVGRLDKDSEGLILLTNDGTLVNKIMRAGNYHEKEYEVRVDKVITADFLDKMRSGVPILDTVTRRCEIKQTAPDTFRIILTQGLNRQIRRMCENLGYQVKRLKRERIMNLTVTGIPVGKYRKITAEEFCQLKQLLSDSSSLPWPDRIEKEKR